MRTLDVLVVLAYPSPAKPWYHTRELFPNLNGHSMSLVGWKLGIAEGIGINYHNSAIQQLPDSDFLSADYTTLCGVIGGPNYPTLCSASNHILRRSRNPSPS